VPELKIGVQLSSLRLPLRKALETAARMGASAVEIDARNQLNPREMTDTGLRQLKKTLDDLNLRVCALGFRTRSGYNVTDRITERVEATKSALRLAYKLGASVVVIQIGMVPEVEEDEENHDWNMLVDVLGELGKHSQRCGAFLAAETGGESGVHLAKLVHALPEGSIGVTLNPGNLIVNNHSPREAIEALGEHIMYVHVKDGVRDLAQGRGVEVPLGRGSADMPELIGMLEDYSYRGYFTIERENATDPIGEVSMAMEYLRNI